MTAQAFLARLDTAAAEFRDAIARAGLRPPSAIIPDGDIHRFSTNGKPDDDAGWYVFFSDSVPAGAFGCWRTGIQQNWSARSDRQMTAAERAVYQRRIEQLQQQRRDEEARRHAEAAEQASALWRWSEPAPVDHPYLVRKGVQPHGLRLYRGALVIAGQPIDGALIVPLRDTDGRLCSLEFISADGDKFFLPGGRKRGASFLIGTIHDVLCIAEGFATGASIYEATGYATAVAFDAGNLRAVAEAYRAAYPTVPLIICGDHDANGVGQAKSQEAAVAVGARIAIPETPGLDWNDIAQRFGIQTVKEGVMRAVNDPGAQDETRAVAVNGGWPHPAAAGEPRSGFAPRTLAQLFDEPEPLEPAWVLEDILPRGALASLVAKPKVGKSTIAYELAVKVAQGRPFLGRATTQGQVLVVAVEEHRREVKRRLRDFGAEQLDAVHVHIGPLSDSPETRHALARYITQHEIALVIVDTLNTFWRVPDENDALAVTQAIKPLLELARQTDACVLLIHHARKSEGEFGDEIRGSGALFSLLDVALILKRHEVETQRKLSVVSRFSEAPPELILELREHGYESLGDPASVGKRAKETKLLDTLTATPTDAKTLAGQAGLPVKAVYTILDSLARQGEVTRSGTGRKGDPFLFAKIRFRFPSKDGTPEETNFNVPNVSGGITLPSPGGKFVSSDPPTIGKETEMNPGALAENSFLATPVPPGRNESAELMEDIEI